MPNHYLLHDFDATTYFCRKCGKALQQVVEDRLRCISRENAKRPLQRPNCVYNQQ